MNDTDTTPPAPEVTPEVSEYFRKLGKKGGSIGGKVKNPRKGFGSNPEAQEKAREGRIRYYARKREAKAKWAEIEAKVRAEVVRTMKDRGLIPDDFE